MIPATAITVIATVRRVELRIPVLSLELMPSFGEVRRGGVDVIDQRMELG